MINLSIKKFIKYLIITLCVLIFLSVFFSFVRQFYLDNLAINNLNELFNTNVEANIPTFFTVCLILINSVILLVVAKNDVKTKSFYWYFWSALFFFLAIDELAQIHEKASILIVQDKAFSAILPQGWVSLWFIFVVIVSIISIKFLLSLPKNTRNQIIVAGLIYITGALIFEVIGGHYDNNKLYHKICTTIEEFLEMGGMIIFISAFLNYLCDLSIDIKIKLIDL